jgi:hypothetical protein
MNWREQEELFLQNEQYKKHFDERLGYANSDLANSLAVSFQMNPNLSPEQISGLAFGGGDPSLSNLIAVEQAKLAVSRNLGPDGKRIQNESEEDRDQGFLGDIRSAIATRLKGVSRTAFTIFDTTVELAQSSLRSLTFLDPVKMLKGEGFLDGDDELRAKYGSGPVGYINWLIDLPTGTTAWVAAEQMLSGGVDMGSGYFVGGSVEEEQSQRQRDILGTIQRGDDLHAWTAGRQLARSLADAGVIDEESWAWNIASGVVDGVIAVVADPSNLIPGIGWGDEVVKGMKAAGSAKTQKYIDLVARADELEKSGGSTAEIIKLRVQAAEEIGVNEKFMDPARGRNLSANEVMLRDRVMQDFGLTGTGANLKTVNAAQFLAGLTQKSGLRLVDKMIETTKVPEIIELHRGKIGFSAAVDLADAKTTEDVVAVYMRAITNPGEDLQYLLTAVPDMGIFRKTETGLWIRNTFNPHVRIGRMLPETSVLDVAKGNDYYQTAKQLMTVMPVNIQAGKLGINNRYVKVLQDEMLDEIARTFARGDKGEIFDMTNKVAERFAEMFKALGYTDTQVKSLTTWREGSQNYVRFAMKDLKGGEPLGRVPLLVSQLITGGAAVIDPAELTRVIRDSGRVKQLIRNKSRAASKWFEKDTQLQNLIVRRSEIDPQDFDAATKLDVQINSVRNELSQMKTPDQSLPLNILKFIEISGDKAMSGFWKPLQLVRAAFIMRVVMEESLRTMSSGTFGGRASLWDYMRTVVDTNSYSIDAAGRRWAAKASDADGLVARQTDLKDELSNIKKAIREGVDVDPALEARLTKEINKLQQSINFIMLEFTEAERFYRKALLNKNRGDAYRTIMKEPRKVLLNNSEATVVDRLQSVQAAKWDEAVAARLMTMHDDDIMSRLAKGVDQDFQLDINGVVKPASEWYAIGIGDDQVFSYWLMQSDEGQDALREISSAYRVKNKDFDPTNFDDVNKWTNRLTDELLYMTGGTRDNLGRIINFDTDLMDVVANGTFAGRKIVSGNLVTKTTEFDREFIRKIGEFRQLPEDGPIVPPQFVEYIPPPKYGTEELGGVQKFVSYFFTGLYGTSSDKLARSPTFRRIYWKQMSELAEMMEPAAAQKVLKNARKAGIDQKLVDNLEQRLRISKGDATFEEIDDIAKGAALGFTKDLLFDATKRGATFDQMRLIMPFGDAWKEVTQTWGKLFIEQRGANLFRGMRNGRAAMGADAGWFGPGDLYGYDEITGEYTATPDGKREPWLYTDPNTKEKRIMIPGSRQLNKLIAKTGFLGEAVEDFTGVGFGVPLKNLSMAGDILPGIGPVADRVIADLVPDDPTYDWVREALFPFGAPPDPTTPGGIKGISDVFMPAWLKKTVAALPEKGWPRFLANLVNDLENDPVFTSTLSQVYSSLVSTGNYETSEIGQIKAQEDAMRVARKVYALRGFAQFIGPGSPIAEYMASTPDGDVLASLVTDHLRRTEDALVAQGQSPTMALPIIMDTYGPDIWLYAAPNTQSELKGMSAKDSWWDWYRTDGNGDAVKAYGLVGGFFGPDEGEFSLNAYSAMRGEGLSRALTPKQRYEIAARSLGFIAYNRVRDSLPPESQRTNMDQILLGQVRRNIEQHFNIDLQSATSQNTRKRQINQAIELVEAADRGEPFARQLMAQPMGESLRIYLGARQRIEQMAIDTLGSANWQRRKDGAYMREFMRNLGQQLSTQDAAFGKMFQYVFDGEMFEDLEVSR